MCDCAGMARTFSEINGMSKSIKPSTHHPACTDYRLIEYSKITANGQSMIVEKNEAAIYVDPENNWLDYGDQYTVEPIFLTVDQFEALPEFEGY